VQVAVVDHRDRHVVAALHQRQPVHLEVDVAAPVDAVRDDGLAAVDAGGVRAVDPVQAEAEDRPTIGPSVT
jgi:hypothetical protein